ncbi:MAG TPA: DUF4388 domain-containing protein [Ktedonobacterales bacterium]|nr:DUF4388 domain-containing protein [Ktedonobacterales bacterium]
MEGLLQDFHLTDLIQLFELSRKTGALELTPIGYQQPSSDTHPAPPIGRIYFVDGNITGAQLSSLQGEDALLSLFLWQAGTFQFVNGLRSPNRTITQTNESLLMAGVRRVDEWSSILMHIPTLQIILFTPPYPPPQAQQVQLSDLQWRFLQAVNGRDTLAAIARRCGLSLFQARIVATKLLAVGFVQRRPPTEAERYFEELVQVTSKDLGELAEPLVEAIFTQAGLPPAMLASLHAVPPALPARILPELEAAAARYIGQHRAQRLAQRLAPIAQTA